jgi:hypothetical protein
MPLAGDLLLVGDDRAALKDLAIARTRIARERSAAAFDKGMRKAATSMLAVSP